jgi:aspartyl protease family protein
MRLGSSFVGLVVATAIALYAPEIEAASGLDVRELVVLSGVLAAAAFVTTLLLSRDKVELVRSVRGFAAGLVFATALVAGYNYRFDIVAAVHRVSGEYVQRPSTLRASAEADGDSAVRIRRRPDGHFIARTEVEGTAMPMLIDTGASTVVLKPTDAQRLGIDVDRLRYTVPVQTANGTTYAAAVKIRSLAVGPIQVKDVDALVSKPGTLRDSLLGMTFLNRLRSYEFAGEYLTLRI